MRELINDLYKLSDNSALFHHLSAGRDLAALAEPLAGASAVPPKTAKVELLRAFRDAIVPALQSRDHSGLDKLIADADINARVTIFGELILTLYALRDGKHSGERVDEVLRRAVQLARDLARAFEAAQPQDSNDEQLLAHGVAMREWAHLLAGYYQAAGLIGPAAELLMVRARVTNCTLSSWPHLVGSAMIDVALALEPIGRVDMAIQCCNGVRTDLHYLVDRIDDPALPEFEKVAALYWLQRACEEFCRLVPDDPNAAQQLQRVRHLREERSYPDAVSAPRFGPIAGTYLARMPYLALILRDLRVNSESVPAICQRYGCPSREVDFYVSAMGSYAIRDTILHGFQVSYDEAHREVFTALDYLRHEDRPNVRDGDDPGAPPHAEPGR
jgi:hypothetical protein